ncbi:MAG: SDR family oxidoreductase [Clostridia bacterium]|nr:SDR family oxidoreductase [Clostridia bacterium]
MKRLDFNNKAIIITGASSGIGKSLAITLINKHNARVYGVSRGKEGLDAVRQELGEKGDRFIPYPMDVSCKDSWAELRKKLENDGVSVDILINGAGILPKFASLERTSIDDFEQVIKTNFLSCVYSCKEIMPLIPTGGCVVNIASASALCPFAGVSSYTASKVALQRFSEALAQERRDISVLCVLPGFVKTNIMKNQNANKEDLKLIRLFSSDLEKTTRKLLRKIKGRKRRIVLGFDGHLMSLLYRLFPSLAPKIISRVLKKSGMKLFEDI